MEKNQKPGMGGDQFEKDKINQPTDSESETGTGTEGQTGDQSETSQDTGFTPDPKS